jgi:hypothetical protein
MSSETPKKPAAKKDAPPKTPGWNYALFGSSSTPRPNENATMSYSPYVTGHTAWEPPRRLTLAVAHDRSLVAAPAATPTAPFAATNPTDNRAALTTTKPAPKCKVARLQPSNLWNGHGKRRRTNYSHAGRQLLAKIKDVPPVDAPRPTSFLSMGQPMNTSLSRFQSAHGTRRFNSTPFAVPPPTGVAPAQDEPPAQDESAARAPSPIQVERVQASPPPASADGPFDFDPAPETASTATEYLEDSMLPVRRSSGPFSMAQAQGYRTYAEPVTTTETTASTNQDVVKERPNQRANTGVDYNDNDGAANWASLVAKQDSQWKCFGCNAYVDGNLDICPSCLTTKDGVIKKLASSDPEAAAASSNLANIFGTTNAPAPGGFFGTAAPVGAVSFGVVNSSDSAPPPATSTSNTGSSLTGAPPGGFQFGALPPGGFQFGVPTGTSTASGDFQFGAPNTSTPSDESTPAPGLFAAPAPVSLATAPVTAPVSLAAPVSAPGLFAAPAPSPPAPELFPFPVSQPSTENPTTTSPSDEDGGRKKKRRGRDETTDDTDSSKQPATAGAVATPSAPSLFQAPTGASNGNGPSGSSFGIGAAPVGTVAFAFGATTGGTDASATSAPSGGGASLFPATAPSPSFGIPTGFTFGKKTAPAAPSESANGLGQAPSSTSSFGGFNSESNAPSAFGTSAGAPAAAGFGNTTGAPSAAAFGNTAGAPSAAFGNTTGAPSAAAFGNTTVAPAAVAFGNTAGAPAAAFGNTANAPSAPSFVSSNASTFPPFGSAPTFDSTPAPTSATPPFGGTSFGLQASNSVQSFGSVPAPGAAQPAFGGAPAFGPAPAANAPIPFAGNSAAPPNQPPAFGAAAPAFGGAPMVFGGGQTAATNSFGAPPAVVSNGGFPGAMGGGAAPAPAPGGFSVGTAHPKKRRIIRAKRPVR